MQVRVQLSIDLVQAKRFFQKVIAELKIDSNIALAACNFGCFDILKYNNKKKLYFLSYIVC